MCIYLHNPSHVYIYDFEVMRASAGDWRIIKRWEIANWCQRKTNIIQHFFIKRRVLLDDAASDYTEKLNQRRINHNSTHALVVKHSVKLFNFNTELMEHHVCSWADDAWSWKRRIKWEVYSAKFSELNEVSHKNSKYLPLDAPKINHRQIILAILELLSLKRT